MGAPLRGTGSREPRPSGRGPSGFDPARWLTHNRGPQPTGLEDCTVDVIGDDGGEMFGFWPHNVVWRHVVRYRVHLDTPRSQPDKLVAVLAALYASEINCGIESFWDGGFTAFLGDHMNGRQAEEVFYPHELDSVAAWFSAKATEIYPASTYAIAIEAATAAETPKSGSARSAKARAEGIAHD